MPLTAFVAHSTNIEINSKKHVRQMLVLEIDYVLPSSPENKNSNNSHSVFYANICKIKKH